MSVSKPAARNVSRSQSIERRNSGPSGTLRDIGIAISWNTASPPGTTKPSSRRNAAAGSGRYISTSLPITASKVRALSKLSSSAVRNSTQLPLPA